MPNKATLYKILVDKGLILAGPIVELPDDDEGYVVFIQVQVDKNGRRKPSSRAIANLTDILETQNYRVTIIAVEEGNNDYDVTLKAILLRQFGSEIRNSFGSFQNGRLDVWIEPKIRLADDVKDNVVNAVSSFAGLIGFKIRAVSFTDAEDVPTPTAILKSLRIRAPCNVDTLQNALAGRGLTVPNVVWLNHALDKLRKSGLVVRTQHQEYFLSLEGLSRLGTSKNSRSPDVLRTLDLAKRR
jgi:hypothetical protein